MTVLRRALIAAGVILAIGLVLVLAGGGGETPAPAPTGSTLDGTWVDADGNGTLERGPGEPMIDRTELAPASPPVRTLATFVQVTDSHVRDEESPARASLLDRLDPDLNSTFRPQEALSPQVLGSTLASIDTMDPDAVLLTGDLTDSNQRNELDQFLGILRGGEVDPDTGTPGYQGPQEASNPIRSSTGQTSMRRSTRACSTRPRSPSDRPGSRLPGIRSSATTTSSYRARCRAPRPWTASRPETGC